MTMIPVAALANTFLVNIAVNNRKLYMRARRRGDVKIYHHDPSRGPRTPGRPIEVAWAATGLAGNQSIKIEAKPGSKGKGFMARDEYSIPGATGDLVTSGSPVRGPAPGITETWSYKVTLLENGIPVTGPDAMIDPEVDIDTDP